MDWLILLWPGLFVAYLLYASYKYGCLTAIMEKKSDLLYCSFVHLTEWREREELFDPLQILIVAFWPFVLPVWLLMRALYLPFKFVAYCGKRWGCNIKL